MSVAGRTDAGVHARGQVASLVAATGVGPQQLADAINGILGPEVVACDVSLMSDGFDARFSASAREYRYRIDTGPTPDPFSARFEWHRPGELSIGRMRSAAHVLVGEHDFASFCRRPGGDRTTRRRLERLTVGRAGDGIVVGARADSFLHQMVRSIVGTLVAVGEGRIEPDVMPAILRGRDRALAGPIAPPHGLTLERVIYGRPRPR